MHSDPVLVRLQDGFALHEKIEKPIIYTGYVVSAAANARYQMGRSKKVLVSCGSGDEGHHLLTSALRAMPYSISLQDHEWHFITGPRMEERHRQEFVAAAQEVAGHFPSAPVPNIHVQMSELPRELAHAAFSISLGGYNTTLEVASSRVPAILLPKFTTVGRQVTHVDTEQWNRLMQLNSRGMASIAHPELALQPEEFARVIDEAYARGATHTPLDMGGVLKTAIEVGRLIAERKVRVRTELASIDDTDSILPTSPVTIPDSIYAAAVANRDDTRLMASEDSDSARLEL